MSNEKIDICLELVDQTDMAYLVTDGDDTVWLPKSEVDTDVEEGDTGIFFVPEWLAMARGLI